MRVVINARDFQKKINRAIKYTDAFVEETKKKERYINAKVANASIEAFYEYLDILARTNPAMLHHVYEWSRVGDPDARLYELKADIVKDKALIFADFLDSTSTTENSGDVFWNKAEVMEEGIAVTIQEVNAQALFFEIDGEEYFRLGPIIVENPGGEATRGAFVKNFEEFYNVYFYASFLKSINFDRHFSTANTYGKLFPSALRGNPSSVGKSAATEWFLTAPGDEYA